MNKKGFTLVELLGVIVLLAIIMVIAVPSVAGINGLINDNIREKKVKIIEEAAVLLGQDVKGSIVASEKQYNGNPCKSITISELVPNYLERDTEDSCLDKGGTGCVIDPADSDNYLDLAEVIIYYKNKRIHAVADLKEELTCS